MTLDNAFWAEKLGEPLYSGMRILALVKGAQLVGRVSVMSHHVSAKAYRTDGRHLSSQFKSLTDAQKWVEDNSHD